MSIVERNNNRAIQQASVQNTMNTILSNRYVQRELMRTLGRAAAYTARRAVNYVKGGKGGNGGKGGKTTARVYREGIYSSRVVTARSRRRKRKKTSLKKEVKALKKNLPKSSVRLYQLSQRVKFVPTNNALTGSSPGAGYSRMFELPVFNAVQVREAIASWNGVDYRATNSAIKVQNIYIDVRGVNCFTANAEVEYFFVQCKDFTAIKYLDDVKDEMSDRGQALSNSVAGVGAPTSITSLYPIRLTLNPNERETPITVGTNHQSAHWRPLSKVKKVRVGPGDEVRMTLTPTDILYKDEVYDDNVNYLRGIDIHLICHVKGAIAHADTHKDRITFFTAGMDGYHRTNFKLVISDGQGTHDYFYNKEYTTQETETVPVQAEDKVSAVEQAQN